MTIQGARHVPVTVLSILTYSHLVDLSLEGAISMHGLSDDGSALREVKSLLQGHMARRQQSQDLKPELPACVTRYTCPLHVIVSLLGRQASHSVGAVRSWAQGGGLHLPVLTLIKAAPTQPHMRCEVVPSPHYLSPVGFSGDLLCARAMIGSENTKKTLFLP